MKTKWKNPELKKQLTLNTLDYLNRNENVSIKDLAEYNGEEYVIITHLMNELENEGLIESETFFNLNKKYRNSK